MKKKKQTCLDICELFFHLDTMPCAHTHLQEKHKFCVCALARYKKYDIYDNLTLQYNFVVIFCTIL